MTGTDGPLVVEFDPATPEPALARFADVLVVVAESGHPVRRCGDLLARYPGLALAVVAVPDGVIVGVRDGTLLVFRRMNPAGDPADAIQPVVPLDGLARQLYLRWAAGCDISGLVGATLVSSPVGGVQLLDAPGQVTQPR